MGLVCGANSSIFLDTDSVEGKGKKTSRFCVMEREYSNKLYELEMFSYQTNSHHKNFHLANIRPLVYTNLVLDPGPRMWITYHGSLSHGNFY